MARRRKHAAHKDGNSWKRIVTLESVMRSAPFVRGVADVRAGRPFDPDAFAGNVSGRSWSYERGRMFAYVFAGPVKDGARVTPAALAAMRAAVATKAII